MTQEERDRLSYYLTQEVQDLRLIELDDYEQLLRKHLAELEELDKRRAK